MFNRVLNTNVPLKTYLNEWKANSNLFSVIRNQILTKIWKIEISYPNLIVKGALSDLRPFLAIESPLKMMKNAFYFTLKARFFFKIFNFLS